MATDIFSINVSALQAAQIGLATTENNIANVNTPGYNRETVVNQARPGQATGSGYVGQGVDVGSVQRLYDQFLSGQVVQQQSTSSQLNTYYSQIQQINNMLGDPTAGLAPALQNFFNSVTGVANAPNSIPARQTMLSDGQSLASTFQAMNQRITDINSSVNGQIATDVATVNGYAQQIANLNQSIVLAQAAAGGQPPNQLMDQRDQLVTKLNQMIGTNVIKQVDGTYNISIGNGQLLVSGANSYSLQTVNSPTDSSQLNIAYGSPNGTTVYLQQSNIQGGEIGGLLAFRSQTLTNTQNMLGLAAAGVAGTFNQQHALGQDLNGNMAASANSFFTDPPAPLVNANSNNTGTAVVSASISDYSKLTGSDYSLTFDGTNYTLTRLSDNTSTVYPSSAPATTTIDATSTDGIKISIPAGAKKGDNFLIRPTANAAQAISVALTDPSKIAAAVPVLTNASVSNTGNVTISSGAVDSAYTSATVNPAVTLTYDSATNTLSGFPASMPVTVTTASSPPVTTTFPAGTNVTYTDGATISFGGVSFVMSGTPGNGDTFTVSPNTNGPSDNRNALLLAGLQTRNTMLNSTASYIGVYSQLVAKVGNQTNQLNVTSTAQTTLLNDTVQAQQSVSGVNLDEEAANLMRYQQAYQAAGKAMQIASTLFDSLIAIGR